jgi:acetyl-CoA synthetase (ADP-forming)
MRLHHISIERIIKPHSVAIIGASEGEAKFGGRITMSSVMVMWQCPINRDADYSGTSRLSDVAAPGPIDRLIAVPVTQLQQIVENAVLLASAHVVINAMVNSTGRQSPSGQIVQIATSHGMRLIGPRYLGMITPAHALALRHRPARYAEQLRGELVSSVRRAVMGALFVFGRPRSLPA